MRELTVGEQLHAKKIPLLSPGDVIRATSSNGGNYSNGKEYTITKIAPMADSSSEYAHIVLDNGREYGLNGWLTDFVYVGITKTEDDLYLDKLLARPREV